MVDCGEQSPARVQQLFGRPVGLNDQHASAGAGKFVRVSIASGFGEEVPGRAFVGLAAEHRRPTSCQRHGEDRPLVRVRRQMEPRWEDRRGHLEWTMADGDESWTPQAHRIVWASHAAQGPQQQVSCRFDLQRTRAVAHIQRTAIRQRERDFQPIGFIAVDGGRSAVDGRPRQLGRARRCWSASLYSRLRPSRRPHNRTTS